MKKTILSFAFLLSVFTVSFAFAAEGDKTVTEDIVSISQGGKLYVEHTKIEGMVGSFDKLIRDRLSRPIVIFDSEGRYIEKVYEYDFNHDGELELLIQMSLDGSLGHKEFSLLQKDSSSYKEIWEASGFPNGTATIKSFLGKTRIYIRYIDGEVTPPKVKIDVYEFTDEGKVVPTTDGEAG